MSENKTAEQSNGSNLNLPSNTSLTSNNPISFANNLVNNATLPTPVTNNFTINQGNNPSNETKKPSNTTNSIFEETCKYLGTENTILCRNFSQVLELTKKVVNKYQKPDIDVVPGRLVNNKSIMEFKTDKDELKRQLLHLSGKTTYETEERLFQQTLRESDLTFKQTNYQIYNMLESEYLPHSKERSFEPKSPKRQPNGDFSSTPLRANQFSTPKQQLQYPPLPITTPIYSYQQQQPPSTIQRPQLDIVSNFLSLQFKSEEVNRYMEEMNSKPNVYMVWNIVVQLFNRIIQHANNNITTKKFAIETILGFYEDNFAKKIRSMNRPVVSSSKKPKIDFDTLLLFCNFTRENKNTHLDDDKPIFALIYFALRCGKKFLARKLAESSKDPSINSLFTKNINQLEVNSKYKKDPFYILLFEVLKKEVIDPNSIAYVQNFRDWIWHRLSLVKNDQELAIYQQEILQSIKGRNEPKIFEILFTSLLFSQASQYLEANKMADDLDFFNQYLESLSNNLK